MTFTKSLTASTNFKVTLTANRWYSGAFKELSIGTLRAVSRAISNFITFKETD